ncbi:unnamed protein product [Adineta ricciae]|uniref:C2 domain-containing protein n=1 Tax=Adineta ricciae TaxID=249248 RepID=A0A814RNJ0_ADIRI|nr:unnamed protein product [Adineta ricciae]
MVSSEMTMYTHSVAFGLKQTLVQTTFVAYNDPPTGYDLFIKFHSAKNLPKTFLGGHTDPYFTAKLDNQLSYTSTIVSNTLSPTWHHEEWFVRNIPHNAKLTVKIYDKDDDKLVDNYIGFFDILDLVNYENSAQGHNITGPFGQHKGIFYLSIRSIPSSNETKLLPRYTFDGPCRYFRHDSLTVGRLTMINANRVYSTWKVEMRRISAFFDPHDRQYWNKDYTAAQAIFGSCPLTLASQSTIKLAHKALHSQTLKNSEAGFVTDADDLWLNIFTDRTTNQIKPCLYTYIIDDHTWRFSQTGAQFVTDFVSKHALLANCSEYVRYAGEFHPRPKYGWDRCDDEWELVFDNGSGTYTPNVNLLNNLKDLLKFNFPDLNIVTYDHNDPLLKESVKKLIKFMDVHSSAVTVTNRLFCV